MFELFKSLPSPEFEVLTKIETRYNYLFEYAPKFEYWNLYDKYKHRNDMSRPDNVCGYIQRIYESYWCVRKFIESGGTPGIALCAGQAPGLFTVTNDFYYGESHPEYGGAYHPHIVHDAAKLPFIGSNTFPIATCLHGLEHLENTKEVLQEWIRIVQPDGLVLVIFPDENYTGKGGGMDHSHKECHSATSFKERILPEIQNWAYVEEYDTLKNNFSVNLLLRKKRF